MDKGRLVIEALKNHPKGLDKYELMKLVSVTNISTFGSFIQRAKKRFPEYKVRFKNRKWICTIPKTTQFTKERPVPNPPTKPQPDRLVDLLTANPEGLAVKDVMARMGFDRASLLYQTSHAARNKFRQYDIIADNGKYYIRDKTTNQKRAGAGSPARTEDNLNDMELSSEKIRKIRALPPGDAENVIDMLKKAFFYQKSAELLIKAAEDAAKLQSTLFPQ